jgi:hypothetical protein
MIGEAVAADWLVVLIIEEAGGFLEAAETEPGHWQVPAGGPGVRQTLKGMILFPQVKPRRQLPVSTRDRALRDERKRASRAAQRALQNRRALL